MAHSRTKQDKKTRLGDYVHIDTSPNPILPKDIWMHEVMGQLPVTDQSSLSQTCRGAYALGYISNNPHALHNAYISNCHRHVKEILLHITAWQAKRS